MLLLQLYIHERRYALNTRHVVEIVPQVNLEPISRSPSYLVGRMNYRGQPVSVIDLRQLIEQEPAREALQTRIIICSFVEGEKEHLVGLLAERVTSTLRAEKKDFHEGSLQSCAVDFLDGIFQDERGSVQGIDFVRMLKRVRNELCVAEIQDE